MRVIFVLGATGKVGCRVVSGLLERDVQVRGLARDADAAGLPGGVDAVSGDLADPQGLAEHLNGVEAVFLVWPFFGADGADEVVATLAAHTRSVAGTSAVRALTDDGHVAARYVLTGPETLTQAEQVHAIGDALELTGEPARPFDEWARDHVEDFR
jgi:uncharacterized protein YbjT (DUF2867 family)